MVTFKVIFMDAYKEEIPYPPVACSRILQTLDSEKRFSVPYGSKSPFSFAFRDLEFRQPGNRSYKYYVALRRCKDIKEYRQHVIELYQDCDINIEVKGEQDKLPIQMIPIPRESHQKLLEIAQKNNFDRFPPIEIPLVFLGTLPLPRMMDSPPTGRIRRDYMTEIITNKIIDFGVIVPEIQVDLGIKFIEIEISKYLAPVEATLSYIGELAKRIKSSMPKPVGFSLRGSMADNPAVNEEAFRVPAFGKNFWENPMEKYWPTEDIDLNVFCGEDDYEEVYHALLEPAFFADVNANIKGLSVSGEKPLQSFQTDFNNRHIDIHVMTDEWMLKSVERHLHLGLEHPCAYYYASSYPILFDHWKDFQESLYKHLQNSI